MSDERAASGYHDDRYFVQSESIRGEGRAHYVSEYPHVRGESDGRNVQKYVSDVYSDRRRAQRLCDAMNAAWKAGDDPLVVLKKRTRARRASATRAPRRAAKKAALAVAPSSPAGALPTLVTPAWESISRSRSGGTLSEIPVAERIRRWPADPTPREVRVRISTFKGIAFNAQHYTLRIEEEDNPFVRFDAQKNEWYYHQPWHDRDGDGFEAELRFTSRDTAERVAEAIIGIMFADETKYAVRFEVGGNELTRAQWNKKYRLPREGD